MRRRPLTPVLKTAFLGASALFAAPLSQAMAQVAENGGEGEPIVLDTVTVAADARSTGAQGGSFNGAGFADGAVNGLVAGTTTIGNGMPTSILETPASVSVVTSKEIQERNADTVEEALDYTSGVVTDFYGSDDRFDYIRIRGLDAYTYRDGLPRGAPFGAPREEIYAFDRVEVLKGANSSVFGVSDPGGAVNYVTKRPRRGKFGEIYTTGGSFDHKEVGFDFGNDFVPDGTLSYRLVGKFQDADKEYNYSNDDEKFFLGGVTWRPSDATSISLVYDHLYIDSVPGSGGQPIGFDFPRSRFFGEPNYNSRGVERDVVSLFFDHDFGNGLSVSSNARYANTESDFGYAYISAAPPQGSSVVDRSFFANESSSEVFVGDVKALYEAEYGVVKSRTLVGGQYRDADADNLLRFGPAPSIDVLDPVYTGRPSSVPIITDSNSTQTTKAIFAQEELTFYDRLIATVGLRNDWLDLDETDRLAETSDSDELSELTSRVGLTYLLTDEFSTFGSYAESVVPASIGLEPERGKQYEVGVKYSPNSFAGLFTASVYDLTKENITRTDPVTLQQVPIGEIEVKGVDLEGKAQLTEHFDLIAAYTYLDAQITEDGTRGNAGNRPAFIPRHSASSFLTYTVDGNGLFGDTTLGVGGRYESASYFDDANTQSVDSHVLFDALVKYELAENAVLQGNVRNVFDEKHVAYGGLYANFYNTGREFDVTLRYSW